MRWAFLVLVTLFLQQANVGSIDGRIVDGATNEPLSGVVILLVRDGASPVRVMTDAEGRFSIQGIVPGSYRLMTHRDGYVRARPTGRKLPGGGGLPFTVNPGERLTLRAIPLDRAGVISGTVLDQAGSPVFHGKVAALDEYFDDFGQRTLRSSAETERETDERGQFRIFGLEAGEYYVRIQSPSEVSKAPAYMIYYSVGTTAPSGVFVTSGSETRLGTIVVPVPKFVPAELKIIADSPVPSGTTRRLRFGLKDMPLPLILVSDRAFGGPELLNISGLPVGINEVQVAWDSPNGLLSGHETIEVGPRDNKVLGEIRMTSGVVVVAHVNVFESTGSMQPLSGVRLSLASLPSSPSSPSMYRFVGQTGIDGTTSLQSLPPSDYQFTIAGLPDNAYISECRSGQGDILNGKMAIRTDSRIEITVKENGGIVTGTVKDRNGRPVQGGLVAFVPSEPQLRDRNWLSGSTTSDQDGEFTFRGIPPGTYKMFAWIDAPGPGPFRNSEFLARYEEAGTSFKISSGQHLEIEVQLADKRD